MVMGPVRPPMAKIAFPVDWTVLVLTHRDVSKTNAVNLLLAAMEFVMMGRVKIVKTAAEIAAVHPIRTVSKKCAVKEVPNGKLILCLT